MTRQATVTLGGFLRQDKRTLMDTPWQVGQEDNMVYPKL